MNSTTSNQTDCVFNTKFKIGKKNFDNDSTPIQKSILQHEDSSVACEANNQRYTLGGIGRSFQQQNHFQDYQQQNKLVPPLSDYDNLPQFDCDRFQSYTAQHFQPNQIAFLSSQNSFHVTQQPFINSINLLKRPREVPKNSNNTKYADTFPHLGDPSLPKELTEQFQPLFCKLCNAQLSSNSMAKLHYKSKNHEKKIRKFLVDYSERTGEPLHERAQVAGIKKPKLEEGNDPKFFHCEVCDLPLTGRLHAESHYMGKNHQKVMSGKAPAGKGHINEEGKWVRRTLSAAVCSGRDSFGLDFVVSPTEISSPKDPAIKKLHCEMCDVKVTSEQQMALHLSGQRHKKRLQQQLNDRLDEVVQGDPENNILSTLSSNIVPSGDLSVYRTPTGYYYCNPCNLTLNSEIQFKQHLGSKKHRKKASGSKD